MKNQLAKQIINFNYSLVKQDIAKQFIDRVKEGKLIKEENELSHFCVYFLPFNAKTKKVFIGHHKKSNLWLSPGGHIDRHELLENAVAREIQEELGVKATIDQIEGPFFFWITEINNPPQVCRRHFDIWYLYKTNGNNFLVDSREFLETRWMNISEARKYVVDKSNLNALEIIEK